VKKKSAIGGVKAKNQAAASSILKSGPPSTSEPISASVTSKQNINILPSAVPVRRLSNTGAVVSGSIVTASSLSAKKVVPSVPVVSKPKEPGAPTRVSEDFITSLSSQGKLVPDFNTLPIFSLNTMPSKSTALPVPSIMVHKEGNTGTAVTKQTTATNVPKETSTPYGQLCSLAGTFPPPIVSSSIGSTVNSELSTKLLNTISEGGGSFSFKTGEHQRSVVKVVRTSDLKSLLASGKEVKVVATGNNVDLLHAILHTNKTSADMIAASASSSKSNVPSSSGASITSTEAKKPADHIIDKVSRGVDVSKLQRPELNNDQNESGLKIISVKSIPEIKDQDAKRHSKVTLEESSAAESLLEMSRFLGPVESTTPENKDSSPKNIESSSCTPADIRNSETNRKSASQENKEKTKTVSPVVKDEVGKKRKSSPKQALCTESKEDTKEKPKEIEKVVVAKTEKKSVLPETADKEQPEPVKKSKLGRQRKRARSPTLTSPDEQPVPKKTKKAMDRVSEENIVSGGRTRHSSGTSKPEVVKPCGSLGTEKPKEILKDDSEGKRRKSPSPKRKHSSGKSKKPDSASTTSTSEDFETEKSSKKPAAAGGSPVKRRSSELFKDKAKFTARKRRVISSSEDELGENSEQTAKKAREKGSSATPSKKPTKELTSTEESGSEEDVKPRVTRSMRRVSGSGSKD